MKKVIFKYELKVVGEQDVLMPNGAEILCVQIQCGQPCVWAKVDPSAPYTPRHFHVYLTGEEIPVEHEKADKYIGTCQIHDGSFVFHVFEAGK